MKYTDIRQEVVVTFFFASVNVRNYLENLCHDHEVTLSQYNILRILKGVHPNAHPRSEIRKRMIEKSDVTRLIDRLEMMGLVERMPGMADKRHSLTVITEKGIEFLQMMNACFTEAEQHLTQGFTETEMRRFVKLLQKFPP